MHLQCNSVLLSDVGEVYPCRQVPLAVTNRQHETAKVFVSSALSTQTYTLMQ